MKHRISPGSATKAHFRLYESNAMLSLLFPCCRVLFFVSIYIQFDSFLTSIYSFNKFFHGSHFSPGTRTEFLCNIFAHGTLGLNPKSRENTTPAHGCKYIAW